MISVALVILTVLLLLLVLLVLVLVGTAYDTCATRPRNMIRDA